MTNGIVKKTLKNKTKKAKHGKFVLLAKSKLNSTENIISNALIDNEIIHEEFTLIVDNEKNIVNYGKVLECWTVEEVIYKEIN